MKKNVLLMSLTGLALVLTSCGGNTASNTPKGSEGDNTVTTDADKTINVYAPSPEGMNGKLAKGFEAATGIKVNMTTKTTGELITQLKSEQSNPVCDVLILASWSDGLKYVNDPLVAAKAYTPKNGDKVYDTFKSSDNKLWGTTASAVGIAYNTTKISKGDIEKLDWIDFGDPSKFSNHPFSIPDPTKSGASKDFVAGFVTRGGKDAENKAILDKWVKNGLINGGGNKPALAALDKGDVDVLLAGVDYNIYANKKKGGDTYKTDIYYPKSGTVVNPRPAMIMGSTKHPKNAELFMDYLLSNDAQKLAADAMLLPGRSDIKADSSRTQMSDIKQFDGLDWNVMSEKGSEEAQYLVDAIKNNK